MLDLNRKITGDWVEFRDSSTSILGLRERFHLPLPVLAKAIQDIRLCVEGGLTEYKRRAVLSVYSGIDIIEYKTIDSTMLRIHEDKLPPVLYAILLQRLICQGLVPLSTEKSETKEYDGDLKSLIQEVQDKITGNPVLKSHKAVKVIQVQIALYRKELETMQKLAPNITADKKQAFQRNFREIFGAITESIRRSYQEILDEERQKKDEHASQTALSGLNLKPLGVVLRNQAETVSALYSTVSFARIEGYKTREALMSALRAKETVMGFLERENQFFKETGGNAQAAYSISRTFGHEIVKILEKEVAETSL